MALTYTDRKSNEAIMTSHTGTQTQSCIYLHLLQGTLLLTGKTWDIDSICVNAANYIVKILY